METEILGDIEPFCFSSLLDFRPMRYPVPKDKDMEDIPQENIGDCPLTTTQCVHIQTYMTLPSTYQHTYVHTHAHVFKM